LSLHIEDSRYAGGEGEKGSIPSQPQATVSRDGKRVEGYKTGAENTSEADSVHKAFRRNGGGDKRLEGRKRKIKGFQKDGQKLTTRETSRGTVKKRYDRERANHKERAGKVGDMRLGSQRTGELETKKKRKASRDTS